MKDGIFPNSLKTAEVIPIFKKGDKQKVNNYRPISLLSPFSKLFERHIHTELTKFITKYNILHPYQYGFRHNSSTEQAITQITDEISNNIQDKLFTCSVFLDLTKAFVTLRLITLFSFPNYTGTAFGGCQLNSFQTIYQIAPNKPKLIMFIQTQVT